MNIIETRVNHYLASSRMHFKLAMLQRNISNG